MCPVERVGKAHTLFNGMILHRPHVPAPIFRGKEERNVRNLLAREDGQGLVEYGLIIFLVAIVIIAILVLLGPQIGAIFSQVTGSI